MEEAFEHIKKGGLDNIDDTESSGGVSLSFSGGVGSRSTTKILGNKTS